MTTAPLSKIIQKNLDAQKKRQTKNRDAYERALAMQKARGDNSTGVSLSGLAKKKETT